VDTEWNFLVVSLEKEISVFLSHMGELNEVFIEALDKIFLSSLLAEHLEEQLHNYSVVRWH
jgi:hypothetical protein